MSSDDHRHGEIIIVRRSHDDHDDHHGGVWKIAFADFMTAMMAFFLVMWLINASNEETKKGVASYFNPIKLMDRTSNPKGVRNPKYGKVSKNEEPEDEMNTVISDPRSIAIKDQGVAETFDEQALFTDPYALLSEIAGGIDQSENEVNQARNAKNGKGSEMGLSGGSSFQDPFDPTAWSMDFGLRPALAKTQKTIVADEKTKPETTEAAVDPQNTKNPPGDDEKPDETVNTKELAKSKKMEKAAKKAEKLADELRGKLEKTVSELGKSAPEFKVISDANGARVTLSDQKHAGMFGVGSARPSKLMVKVMSTIGEILAKNNGFVTISGHTDARKYRSGEYDNWRLSTARAHMAYYMLVRGGLPEARVEKIEGHADVDLADAKNPFDAVNRRIEIYLRLPG